jgi:hypothetical protein
VGRCQFHHLLSQRPERYLMATRAFVRKQP